MLGFLLVYRRVGGFLSRGVRIVQNVDNSVFLRVLLVPYRIIVWFGQEYPGISENILRITVNNREESPMVEPFLPKNGK